MSKGGEKAAEGSGGLKRYYLYLSVFLSGGAILVIEIAAGRVLAPHFGNTLYTWTSMIGIILAALAVGYAAGGRMADRNPNARMFFLIMIAGAGLVALVPVLRAAFLPALEKGLSLRSGPIIGGLLLFAAPGCVLAALTPYAVKLSSRGSDTLGTVTGNLFTWSTAGSIFGTFITGFFLIPAFGLNAIFLSTAIALAVVGAAGLYLYPPDVGGKKADAKALKGVSIFAGLCVLAGAAWTGSPPGLTKETIHFRENMYHTLRVIEGDREGKRVRQLFLDYQPEGAMVIGDDRSTFFKYTRYLALGPAAVPDIRRMFFIGGGAFTMPKALHLMRPEAEIVVAELDQDVIAVGEKYFRLDKYPRIKAVSGDGRRSLKRAKGKWDFIVGDAYRGLRNIPAHLVTREFFAEARDRLAPGGAMMLNLIAARSGPGGALYASVYRTMAPVFPDLWVFSVDPKQPAYAQNILLLAFRDRDAARRRKFLERLESDPELKFAADSRVSPPSRRSYGPVMTDEYAPVEYLINLGL
ncbi:MAG: fused MFS/spermidine synthase [Nitrospinota bacterium]|jgi:spermidine synthase|nr:fused MFS/spermidine synthase [Nitrospinota bacterium]MDP7166796.1 fused MFS/spermidine synthase [Nitrospinota bacterium]MDP7370518.1 fused MFS/spermidine synthase [Nitrospinota bacterium]MDP7503623.1 fused MFS/spermidine synthase [Nitrospinota bacterium]MDP7665012.1 fused MFS/spermidine synthase [Nitrospinota bacterium]